MIWAFYILGFVYCFYMAIQIFRFKNFPKETPYKNTKELPLSIILPFKNEASNLPNLLKSLKGLNYANHEFIFVDDSSADKGSDIIRNHSSPLLLVTNKKEPGKKGALETGIAHAKNNFVITWDTDITVHSEILKEFNQYFQQNKDMILGPVSFSAKNNFIANYGMLENSSLVAFGLMDAKANKPNMANGANFGFKRDLFLSLGGYSSNKAHAGGDDEFLMHLFMKTGAKIAALSSRNAMVYSQSMPTWKSFIHQRIRWGKKVKEYPNGLIKKYLISQLLFIAYLTLSILAICNNQYLPLTLVLGAKVTIDLTWFIAIKPFFQIKIDYAYALLSSVFQILIIPLVFIHVLIGKAEWKGRDI